MSGSGQGAEHFDSNGDGVVDAAAVANADGTTSVFLDSNGDGVFDALEVVRADGAVPAVFLDADQNGVLETVAVDQTGDGVFDAFAQDVDQDGVLDVVVQDLDQNGVDDAAQASAPALGPSVVGPVANPDPVYGLVVGLAGATGAVAYPEGDADHDGWSDSADFHPDDPFRA